VVGEAFTAVWTGQPLSTEIKSQGPTLLHQGEGEMNDGAIAMPSGSLAVSQTLSMSRNSLRGNREILEVSSEPVPTWPGDEGQIPINHHERFQEVGRECSTVDPSKAYRPRHGEERLETSGNPDQKAMAETLSSENMSSSLERVRQAAIRDKTLKFTNLLHHVDICALTNAYQELNRTACPGIDGVTWAEYGEQLEMRLADLCRRIHTGSYKALPSKRAWIPKADGSNRPLGIASLEDKIVQEAVKTVLEAIYETEFAGFSYGFRPGRCPEKALDAVWVGIVQRKVNWIVDADIKGFFDTIDHQWLMKFLEYRVADPRILRLIANWLRAGVSEARTWMTTKVGTPQGSVISPFLANVYLHYVLDLWVKWWRNQSGVGDVIVVRYADDFVLGFQREGDAKQFLHDLQKRLALFSLTLHPEKTRLIEFGRFATANRAKCGLGVPETFNFLGFTHRCGETHKNRRFTVIRNTMAKRLGAAVLKTGQKLKEMRSLPIAEQGRWLGSVVRGWFQYHAIPGNSFAICNFRNRIIEAWRRALRRRSQRAKIGTTWSVMTALADQFLPRAIILKGYPNERLCV
jgi:group II intron reverse transcriptase/maturase